jgi:hypothetical protein
MKASRSRDKQQLVRGRIFGGRQHLRNGAKFPNVDHKKRQVRGIFLCEHGPIPD